MNKDKIISSAKILYNAKLNAKELGIHSGKVSDVAYSKNGKLMASAGWGGSIMIWDMDREQLILKTTAGHKGPINSLQFSKDGMYLYSSGYDGTIRKFDIFNNISKGILISHGWGINVFYFDEEQNIANDYQAVCTPDFFGYNKNLELQYRGRIRELKDLKPIKSGESDLFKAMKLIGKTGNGPKDQIPSMGCNIKWIK